jgi:hypothetical protein
MSENMGLDRFTITYCENIVFFHGINRYCIMRRTDIFTYLHLLYNVAVLNCTRSINPNRWFGESNHT